MNNCGKVIDPIVNIIKKYYESPLNKLHTIHISDFLPEKAESVKVGKGPYEEQKSKRDTFIGQIIVAFNQNAFTNFRKIRSNLRDEDEIVDVFNLSFPSEYICKIYVSTLQTPLYKERKYDYKFNISPKEEIKCKISSTRIDAGPLTGWRSMETTTKIKFTNSQIGEMAETLK